MPSHIYDKISLEGRLIVVKQSLEIRQGQTLTMTAQLQQAIKLLQLNNVELTEFVEEELEKNPLLEREGSSNNDQEIREPSAEPTSTDTSNSETSEPLLDNGEEGGYDYTTSDYAGVGAGGNAKFDDPDYNFENTLEASVSLREHLLDQIQVDFKDDQERAIATLMVDYLTEAGYFRVQLEEVAIRLGCEVNLVEGALKKLQQLNPTGIFATDLSECLTLQLKEQNRFDPAIEKLLQNLDLLAKHDLKKLKSLCNVNDEDLMDMIAEIKKLNPKPAVEFDHFISQTAIPDVIMKPLPKSKGGGWRVDLNNDTLPRVLVNREYYTEINSMAKSKNDKKYITEKLNTANWLINAMDQRAQTILKVAGEIIIQQENFFNFGVEFLKPLVLKNIAEEVGVHESTVSRVTTNKYIGTPRGLFELKYFFSSGVSSSDGNVEFSSEAIKARIKTLTEAEAVDNILSDDDIVKLLTDDGISIARRTVAKYREALKIPSSVQRRRMKKQTI